MLATRWSRFLFAAAVIWAPISLILVLPGANPGVSVLALGSLWVVTWSIPVLLLATLGFGARWIWSGASSVSGHRA